MKVYVVVFIVFLSQFGIAYADELPEFFGCYIKTSSDQLIEVEKNNNINSTGWFVPKPKSNNGSLQSFQKNLMNNDMFSAFDAASKPHKFISNLSDSIISAEEITGIIVYSETNIEKIKIFKLSNKVIPGNARLVEYHGPEPINIDKMWFTSEPIEYRSKPVKEKMYYIAPKETLQTGCYALDVDGNYYDFEIKNYDSKNPLIGKWSGGLYLKERKFFGGKTFVRPYDYFIERINEDGSVIGKYKQYNPNKNNEIIDEGEIEGMVIDINNNAVTQTNEDKGKKDTIYGVDSGKLSYSEPSKCMPCVAKFLMKFKPYEKYKDNDFLKKYEIYWKFEKN